MRPIAMTLSKLPLTSGTEETSEHTPTVSLVLAYAAMVPLAVGATADIGRDRRAIEATGKPVSELGSAR